MYTKGYSEKKVTIFMPCWVALHQLNIKTFELNYLCSLLCVLLSPSVTHRIFFLLFMSEKMSKHVYPPSKGNQLPQTHVSGVGLIIKFE